VLDSIGVSHTGTFKDNVSSDTLYPLILAKNNFKIALLNYTYGTNGIPVPKPTIVNLIDTTRIAEDIKKVYSDSVDIIVAFMHWGAEYQSLPDKNQMALTSWLQQKGVQLVIGAHPHVLQPVVRDTSKQTLVAYSLGNFVSGQRDRYKNGGMMLQVELEKSFADNGRKSVTIKNAGYYLHYMHKNTEKKYIAIPAFAEENLVDYIDNSTAREALQLFLNDSRALFKKHNVGVPEIKNQPR
jgi:poly-gamma-glutamate synthesis protein (capsule biosynthesis protein)